MFILALGNAEGKSDDSRSLFACGWNVRQRGGATGPLDPPSLEKVPLKRNSNEEQQQMGFVESTLISCFSPAGDFSRCHVTTRTPSTSAEKLLAPALSLFSDRLLMKHRNRPACGPSGRFTSPELRTVVCVQLSQFELAKSQKTQIPRMHNRHVLFANIVIKQHLTPSIA
ncbi:hypothetical protein C0Q70_14551 [Pomacea canaliculata]|uniref:Uncharacterized protein n=1 Tax=Pomacea canaliculata TaxID=400727 RepID=A0A2T7NSC7_POMCA|nr:hypothetical protein C0Q70_14551 [Pomacea canaliculata]